MRSSPPPAWREALSLVARSRDRILVVLALAALCLASTLIERRLNRTRTLRVGLTGATLDGRPLRTATWQSTADGRLELELAGGLVRAFRSEPLPRSVRDAVREVVVRPAPAPAPVPDAMRQLRERV